MIDQVRASIERFSRFTERDADLLCWRFDKGYMAELTKCIYQKMFVGANQILDVGCGVGRAAHWAKGANYFGIDLSETLVRQGMNEKNRHLAVANGTALPFLDETFDRITCYGLFHHLPREQIQSVLKEMARVLKKGGEIAITEGNPWNIYMQLLAYLRPAERGILHLGRRNFRRAIESVQGIEVEQFEYDHIMFWAEFGTFILRRWSWPTSPWITALLLSIHKIIKSLTPGPFRSLNFWYLRKSRLKDPIL